MATGTGKGTKAKTAAERAKLSVEQRLEDLEKRLDALLDGTTELEIKEVQMVSVAPRSKLRVSCE